MTVDNGAADTVGPGREHAGTYLDGSGYVFLPAGPKARPVWHCGFRLAVRDLPKGII